MGNRCRKHRSSISRVISPLASCRETTRFFAAGIDQLRTCVATTHSIRNLYAEFTRRGITEKKALDLLANLKPGQDVVAQLEHTDYMVQNARFPIYQSTRSLHPAHLKQHFRSGQLRDQRETQSAGRERTERTRAPSRGRCPAAPRIRI